MSGLDKQEKDPVVLSNDQVKALRQLQRALINFELLFGETEDDLRSRIDTLLGDRKTTYKNIGLAKPTLELKLYKALEPVQSQEFPLTKYAFVNVSKKIATYLVEVIEKNKFPMLKEVPQRPVYTGRKTSNDRMSEYVSTIYGEWLGKYNLPYSLLVALANYYEQSTKKSQEIKDI